MSCCVDYRGQLEKSQLDELCDAGFYAQIAEEAPTDELRELIISIVGDEYGHARVQAALLGCCPPCPPCPAECPKAAGDFCEDVKKAIQAELDAIKRYSQLARCAPTQKVRYLLTSMMGDEYAHVRIWSAMLQTKSICNPKPCKEEPCKEAPCKEMPCKEYCCKESYCKD